MKFCLALNSYVQINISETIRQQNANKRIVYSVYKK